MLEVIQHIEPKGKERKMIAKAISSVLRDFDERVPVKKLKKLEVFVTKDPVNVSKRIFRIKLRRHSEIREWICETAASFSYWVKGKTPTIMLNANQKIFKEQNYDAIKGLFAHELMHLMNKLDGIEDKLDAQAEVAARNIFAFLARHKEFKPFTRERLLSSFIRVTSTAILIIKDILANSRAMSFGFDDELYENYRVSLKDVKERIAYTDEGIINALRVDKKHFLDNAFLSYLGLRMTWITFEMFHHTKWVEELKEMTDIQMPNIIKESCNKVLNELLRLRSGDDVKQIAKILLMTQMSYFFVEEYYCERLRIISRAKKPTKKS